MAQPAQDLGHKVISRTRLARRPRHWAALVFALAMPTSPTHSADPDAAKALALRWPLVYYARDSDGLTISKVGVGLLPHAQNTQQWAGLEAYRLRYAQFDTHLNARSVGYVKESLSPQTGLGYTLRVGVREDKIQRDWVFDANRSWAAGGSTRLEVYGQRDRVESLSALQAGTTMNLIGAAIDHTVHPRVTLVGAVAKTWFSDDAQRAQQRLRVIGDLFPEVGVTLQWSLRKQTGRPASGPRRYFNPEEMTESLAVVGWRRRLEGWQVHAHLGVGRQEVGTERSPARQFDLAITSPAERSQAIGLRLGHHETFGLSGPGYQYSFVDLHAFWRF